MSQRIPDDNVKFAINKEDVDMQRSKNELTIKKEDSELERNKWRGRRKMGWVALTSILAVTALLLFAPISEERLKILSEPITWFYFSMASVIGAYMGFTTWASRK